MAADLDYVPLPEALIKQVQRHLEGADQGATVPAGLASKSDARRRTNRPGACGAGLFARGRRS